MNIYSHSFASIFQRKQRIENSWPKFVKIKGITVKMIVIKLVFVSVIDKRPLNRL